MLWAGLFELFRLTPNKTLIELFIAFSSSSGFFLDRQLKRLHCGVLKADSSPRATWWGRAPNKYKVDGRWLFVKAIPYHSWVLTCRPAFFLTTTTAEKSLLNSPLHCQTKTPTELKMNERTRIRVTRRYMMDIGNWFVIPSIDKTRMVRWTVCLHKGIKNRRCAEQPGILTLSAAVSDPLDNFRRFLGCFISSSCCSSRR